MKQHCTVEDNAYRGLRSCDGFGLEALQVSVLCSVSVFGREQSRNEPRTAFRSFIRLFVRSFVRSFVRLMVRSLVLWLVGWLVGSFVRSLFVRSYVHGVFRNTATPFFAFSGRRQPDQSGGELVELNDLDAGDKAYASTHINYNVFLSMIQMPPRGHSPK